jgi:phospholipid/cholesterol/gamma-HCH transport system substrate-binding protein
LTVNEIPGSSDGQVDEVVPEQAGQRQVRIGVFVIAGLIATIYLLYLLTDPATFRNRYKITTTVENVMGLRKGDPVQMRGVNIGQVNDFEMGTEGENVVIILEVEGQWLIPEGSRTQLVSPGIMAPRTVEVVPGPGPGTIGAGDALPGSTVKGLLDDTESLGEKGQLVLDRIAELLSPENLEAISGSTDGLNTLVGELSDVIESESDNLSELIQSFNRAADGLAEITGDGAELGEDLASAMAKADSVMDRLNATSERVNEAAASLQTILTRVENGEGTLGQLSVNDSLFTNLTAAVESARLLMDDLRENPGRYINVSIF